MRLLNLLVIMGALAMVSSPAAAASIHVEPGVIFILNDDVDIHWETDSDMDYISIYRGNITFSEDSRVFRLQIDSDGLLDLTVDKWAPSLTSGKLIVGSFDISSAINITLTLTGLQSNVEHQFLIGSDKAASNVSDGAGVIVLETMLMDDGRFSISVPGSDDQGDDDDSDYDPFVIDDMGDVETAVSAYWWVIVAIIGVSLILAMAYSGQSKDGKSRRRR